MVYISHISLNRLREGMVKSADEGRERADKEALFRRRVIDKLMDNIPDVYLLQNRKPSTRGNRASKPCKKQGLYLYSTLLL